MNGKLRALRKIGKIERGIFPVGFGGAALSGEGRGYGFGPISHDKAISLLKYVKDLGVNLFDLAPIYGFGLAEKRLGEAFKDKNWRDKIFIVDKGGVTWDSNKRVDINNSPKVIELMLSDSLRNLNMDFIDLYLIHWPDPRIDIRRPLEFLEREREKGKVLNIGLGNTNIKDIKKALEITKSLTIQNEVNLFRDQTLTFLNDLKHNKIGLMGWGTLDKGILSGSVRKEDQQYEKEDCRSWAPWWKKEKELRKKKFLAQQKINELISHHKLEGVTVTLLDVAIHYCLMKEHLDVSLVGGKTIHQWDEILKSLDKEIPESFLDNLKVEVDGILWNH